MSRLPGDTRKTIIDLGEKLLLNQGFNGFSYADIAGSLGIKNAAVHYHFPSKCDLGVEIIRRARQRFDEWGARKKRRICLIGKNSTPFLTFIAATSTNGRSVCLSVRWKPIMSSLPAPMQEEAKGLDLKTFLAWLKSF